MPDEIKDYAKITVIGFLLIATMTLFVRSLYMLSW